MSPGKSTLHQRGYQRHASAVASLHTCPRLPMMRPACFALSAHHLAVNFSTAIRFTSARETTVAGAIHLRLMAPPFSALSPVRGRTEGMACPRRVV